MLRPTPLHPRLEALQYLDFTNAKTRPWDRLLEKVRAASNAPITYSISIPLNSPPFIRQSAAALDSINSKDRDGAIQTLKMARIPAAYAVLREALKHPLWDVRSAAISSLKGINDPATVAALTEALNDPDGGCDQQLWGLSKASMIVPP
jgi:HEAT repeat protein